MKLKAPFPWFGGKSRVADLVWQRFGNTTNYVEPFAGSLAVLLGRPHDAKNETVNDLDCYIANFWRALREDPEGVAAWADWPINEADLHARHEWLHGQDEFRERMHSDPEHHDPKIAGWWVWGISAWIGDNWCSPNKNKSFPRLKGRSGIHADGTGRDMRRPTIMSGGQGVHRTIQKRPQLKKGGAGIHRKATRTPRSLPDISGHRGARGRGCHAAYCVDLCEYLSALSYRLRHVRVCCGQWDRILGPSPTTHIGMTSVFLDPPYGVADRDKVYNHDDRDLSTDVFTWCLEHGDEKKLRIALCGYEGEHNALEVEGWGKVAWAAGGGYGNQGTRGNANRSRERIWFSPHCLKSEGTLFGEPTE